MHVQPEESINIQHAIGADIIMQLDDVGETCFLLEITPSILFDEPSSI